MMKYKFLVSVMVLVFLLPFWAAAQEEEDWKATKTADFSWYGFVDKNEKIVNNCSAKGKKSKENEKFNSF